MFKIRGNAVIIDGLNQTGEELNAALTQTQGLMGYHDRKQGLNITKDDKSVFALPFSRPSIFIFAEQDQSPIPLYEPVGKIVLMSGQDPHMDWQLKIDSTLSQQAHDFAVQLYFVLRHHTTSTPEENTEV